MPSVDWIETPRLDRPALVALDAGQARERFLAAARALTAAPSVLRATGS